MVIHSRKLWKTLLEVPTEQQCKTLPHLQLLLAAALPAVPGALGAVEHREEDTQHRRSIAAAPAARCSARAGQCQGLLWHSVIPGHSV